MKKSVFIFLFLIRSFLHTDAQTVIVYPDGYSMKEQLAAKEIRKYIYLCSGELLELRSLNELPESGDYILVSSSDRSLMTSVETQVNHEIQPHGFVIKSIALKNQNILIISGYDPTATLHAAYRLAEHLGVGFDLAGDIIPDSKIKFDISGYDEVGEPFLDILGILPFHDFHQGPDLWNKDDYRAVISQLPKLGMNFIGLHTYPKWSGTFDKNDNTPQGPEPTVWIGLPEDIKEDGNVNWSYPAYYAHTHRPDRIWGFAMRNTDKYHAGSSQLFEKNGYSSDLIGITPSTESSNLIFNRTGQLYKHAFTHANNVGVKTALGTELPMGVEPKGPEVDETWVRTMPPELQERLRSRGQNPEDQEVVKSVYKGIFQRIMKTHPLDYYWLWSWEVWSMHGASKKQIKAFETDIKIAQDALHELGNPFQLGLAAWKIGTQKKPAQFDDILPFEAPFYGLWDEAEGFEKLNPKRTKWAATWAEEDWGLNQPQLELHRIYNDAKAAWDKEADGFIAKHWRTRILSANIVSMKNLFWTYGPTGNTIHKTIPMNKNAWIDTFYLNWSENHFGPEVCEPIAKILSGLDKAGEPGSVGAVPSLTGWETDQEDGANGAPGAISVIENSWEEEQRKYTFVEQLEELRHEVKGKNNLDRFDYWLKSFQVIKLMAEYGTLRNHFENYMEEEKWSEALETRAPMARIFEKIITLQIEKMVNVSDLGEIINLELLNWHQLVELKWDTKLEKGLGHPIPENANPSPEYKGKPFIKVISAVPQIYQGEDLKIKILVMGDLVNPTLHLRPLGQPHYQKLSTQHLGRSVYEVTIKNPLEDFEYYLEATSSDKTFVYPASAPKTNAVVTVLEPTLEENSK